MSLEKLISIGSVSLLFACSNQGNSDYFLGVDSNSNLGGGVSFDSGDSGVVQEEYTENLDVGENTEELTTYFTEKQFGLQPLSADRMQKLHKETYSGTDEFRFLCGDLAEQIFDDGSYSVFQGDFFGNDAVAILEKDTGICHFQDYASNAFTVLGVGVSVRDDASLVITSLLAYDYLCEEEIDSSHQESCARGESPLKVQMYSISEYLEHPTFGSPESYDVSGGENYPWHFLVSNSYLDSGLRSEEEVRQICESLPTGLADGMYSGQAFIHLDDFTKSNVVGEVCIPFGWEEFGTDTEVNQDLYLSFDGEKSGISLYLQRDY